MVGAEVDVDVDEDGRSTIEGGGLLDIDPLMYLVSIGELN